MNDSHTARGVAPPPPADAADRTRTLKGLGPIRSTLRGLGEAPAPGKPEDRPCPVCNVSAGVPPQLAAALGIAIASVRSKDEIRHLLCTEHRRLYRLIVQEMTDGPNLTSGTWED